MHVQKITFFYRNEFKNLSECPSCGAYSWRIRKYDKKIRKGVPKKVLWYFLITQIVENLTWHENKRMFQDIVRDLCILENNVKFLYNFF